MTKSIIIINIYLRRCPGIIYQLIMSFISSVKTHFAMNTVKVRYNVFFVFISYCFMANLLVKNKVLEPS